MSKRYVDKNGNIKKTHEKTKDSLSFHQKLFATIATFSQNILQGKFHLTNKQVERLKALALLIPATFIMHQVSKQFDGNNITIEDPKAISYIAETDRFVAEQIDNKTVVDNVPINQDVEDYYQNLSERVQADNARANEDQNNYEEQSRRHHEAVEKLNSQSLNERYTDLCDALANPSLHSETIRLYMDAYNINISSGPYEKVCTDAFNSAAYHFLLDLEKDYVSLEVTQLLHINGYTEENVYGDSITLHHDSSSHGEHVYNTFTITPPGDTDFYEGSFSLSKSGGKILQQIINVSDPDSNKKTITHDELVKTVESMRENYEKGNFFIDPDSFYNVVEQNGVTLHADSSTIKNGLKPSKSSKKYDEEERG